MIMIVNSIEWSNKVKILVEKVDNFLKYCEDL